MRRTLRLTVFAALSAGATVAAGWWTLPLLGGLWPRVVRSDRRPVQTAALGAVLGWIAVLGLQFAYGPVPAVAKAVDGALGLPPWGFPAATLTFAALLAGTAALLTKPPPPG